MKVMSIVGTRPELIKMSEIIKKLDKYTDHVFVHTGQNYDYELNEIFYGDLGLRKPDYFLNVAQETLGKTIGKIISEAENALLAEKPDAVVILGDTNSALAGIVAKRFKIPLFHLEAGNRCFDDNVPEEINRRILDHISDVNMVYTQSQRLYLRDEGISKDRIFIMGSPMREVFNQHLKKIDKSKILKELGLSKGKYYLVSLHRDENTEIARNLAELLATINTIADITDSPVVVSVHPRTAKKIEGVKFHENVILHPPFGFFDYVKLQKEATCVISDSGTIAEESSLLNFPAITIRNAIERPEAIDKGSILMTGVDMRSIIDCLGIVQAPNAVPDDYVVDNCSERVLRVILGYTPYVRRYVWHES